MMAICSLLHEIDRMGILKLGQDKASNIPRGFEKIKVTAERTQMFYIHKIIQIDPAI